MSSTFIQRYLRIEVPYRTDARDIALYLIWQHGTSFPATTFDLPPNFLNRNLSLHSWLATSIFQRPAPGSQHSAWLSSEEALDIVAKLATLLQKIITTVSPKPAFIILHIEGLRTWKPRLYRVYSNTRKKNTDRYVIEVQKAFVERLQALIDTYLTTVSNAWEPNSFDHYDRYLHQRGWLTITPGWALLVGLGTRQERILIDLIHPRDISIGQGGIASEKYDDLLRRVIEWNSTEDVFEAVDHLENIVESGRKSTNGQLWLNFALAGIGVLLALAGLTTIGLSLILPLALFVLASLMHAFYASTGYRAFQIAGVSLFVVALAAVIILYVPVFHAHLPN